MSWIEIIAVVFSLMCVLFSIRRSVWNWPIGQIGILAYLVLFYQVKLYADMVLQVVFLAQGFYGWYHWSESRKHDHQIIITTLTTTLRLITIVFILLVTVVWGFLLKIHTDAAVPFVDAFASTLSFVATGYMARRKLESWALWIIADIVYIGLFFYKELYLSCGVYSVFLALAVAGFIEWNKNVTKSALR